MATTVTQARLPWARTAPLLVAVRAVLGPFARRRPWKAAAHAALAVPVGVLALVCFLPVVMPPYALLLAMLDRDVSADTVLPPLLGGLVILYPALALARLLAMLERRLAGRLLGVRPVGTHGRRWRRVVLEEATWRELLWLLVRVAVATLVIAYSVLVVALLAGVSEPSRGSAGSPETALVLAPLALLVGVHAGRGLAWVQARAALPLLGDVAAARLAQEQERSRRLEDRARLARELHDSVGHGVTLMVLQAGAARATPGDDGREALAAVERSGRAVMADLHRVLGLLDPTTPDAAREVDARPWSGIDGALQAASAAGVDVHRVVRSGPVDVPADVEALVTRCLREALTNVATHAPGARVVVDLTFDGDGDGDHEGEREGLVLSVHDDGARDGTVAPVLPNHRGSGLAGLATDAAALGGRLDAGPRDGGFAVVLRVPTTGDGSGGSR